MNTRLSYLAILFFSVFSFAAAQVTFSYQLPADKQLNVNREAQTSAKSKNDVVRISVTLVQIDAVVLDRQGKQVTGLKAEDFELTEDARPQQITNCAYVAAQPVFPGAGKPDDKAVPPPPGGGPAASQIQRTIALVVDDLGLSFESTTSVRQALKKFVDAQMQPGDLVAIVRTGRGMGALQQFTTDKRVLYAAIEHVKWNPNGRGGIGPIAPIEVDALGRPPGVYQPGTMTMTPPPDEEMEHSREDFFTVGTLGALTFVVRGLRDLPGRKSVVLFSDGVQLIRQNYGREGGRPDRTSHVFDALRRLIDSANRASAVVYTMDARGLQNLGLNATDDTSDLHQDISPDRLNAALDARRGQFLNSQDGLEYLAQQTGGLFIRNRNDLSRGLERVLDDQRGYYLLGYVPDESVFKKEKGEAKFHKLTLRVKREGLSVRSRTGFYGIADDDGRPTLRPRAEQMLAALLSPFNAADVHLRLTSLFGDDPKAGSFLRSFLHIDGRDISFEEQPDGWRKGVIDVVLVTFGESGAVLDQINRTYTVRVKEDAYQEVQRGGLVYTLNLPIKKPGAYQLRAAVRDAATARTGSAGEFVEVPDLARGRLSISGIVLDGRDSNGPIQSVPAEPSLGAKEPNETDHADPQGSPAVRQFKPGMKLEYSFLIFNAQLGKATRTPQLETQMLLFRDGQKVVTGEVTSFDPGHQEDLKRITANGRFQLAKGVKPGEYVLQVIVNDKLADTKHQTTTTQWIDFEIVK